MEHCATQRLADGTVFIAEFSCDEDRLGLLRGILNGLILETVVFGAIWIALHYIPIF